MTNVAELDETIEKVFSERLASAGFTSFKRRKWVRNTKGRIYEFVWVQPLKGAMYSTAWGLSTGHAPAVKRTRFSRPRRLTSTLPDLTIDPIDQTGTVSKGFQFLAGVDTSVPVRAIEASAAYFVPRALKDFDQVHDVQGFCDLFEYRQKLEYRRFTFFMYVRHRLVSGFVQLLQGRIDSGMAELKAFCETEGLSFEDPAPRACIDDAVANASDPTGAVAGC